jgi:hypothetical protein
MPKASVPLSLEIQSSSLVMHSLPFVPPQGPATTCDDVAMRWGHAMGRLHSRSVSIQQDLPVWGNRVGSKA